MYTSYDGKLETTRLASLKTHHQQNCSNYLPSKIHRQFVFVFKQHTPVEPY